MKFQRKHVDDFFLWKREKRYHHVLKIVDTDTL